jgi:hypothetical protein
LLRDHRRRRRISLIFNWRRGDKSLPSLLIHTPYNKLSSVLDAPLLNGYIAHNLRELGETWNTCQHRTDSDNHGFRVVLDFTPKSRSEWCGDVGIGGGRSGWEVAKDDLVALV